PRRTPPGRDRRPPHGAPPAAARPPPRTGSSGGKRLRGDRGHGPPPRAAAAPRYAARFPPYTLGGAGRQSSSGNLLVGHRIGGHADDGVDVGVARQDGDRLVEAQQDRSDGGGAAQGLQHLVGGVAGRQRREDQHVGGVGQPRER